MAKMIVFSLILAQFLIVGVAFQTVHRNYFVRGVRCIRLASEDDLSTFSVVELKSKLRTAGLQVSGTKKELIERLSSKPTSSTPIVKTSIKLGGLLRRRSVSKVAKVSDDVENLEMLEEKVEVIQLPPVPITKSPVEAKKVVKAWDSRKELVTKTPAVEVKKVAPTIAAAPQQEVKKTRNAMTETKKTVKSVKEVVAAYDIDDDDFMSQFMDTPNERKPTEQQSTRSMDSSPKAPTDSGPVSGSPNDNRAVWPGPGVSWMPGPSGETSKKDQNRGRNTLMAAADDDLQRMVDDRNDARYRRDYDGADAIREELRTIYRVEIYDKLGEWVAADGRWGLSNRKRGAGASEDGVPVMAKIQTDAKPCVLTYDQIMDMVVKRTTARRTRQFQVADDIRDQLAREGVELFDKVNEWRTYDGLLRGIQSEDFEKYEVKKDTERYDRSRSRDNAW